MKLPEGWPTEEMVKAGAKELYSEGAFPTTDQDDRVSRLVIEAALAVAPTLPAQVVCKDPSAMCEEVGCKLDCGPAQEDEPVAYEIYDATRKPCSWIYVSKEKYLELTSIGWNGRTLYTRPAVDKLNYQHEYTKAMARILCMKADHDKLRKIAQEILDIADGKSRTDIYPRIIEKLRAALEGK